MGSVTRKAMLCRKVLLSHRRCTLVVVLLDSFINLHLTHTLLFVLIVQSQILSEYITVISVYKTLPLKGMLLKGLHYYSNWCWGWCKEGSLFNSTSLIFLQQLISASLCCLYKHSKMPSHWYYTTNWNYCFQKEKVSFKGQNGNLVLMYITAFLSLLRSVGFIITNPF